MRITMIGSGNVATHLSAALKNAGHNIVQVYSRGMQNASLLAYHVGAEPVNDFDAITADTDLFIISVKDDAIIDVAAQLAGHRKLMVHTSGATDIGELMLITGYAGVLYPLQTFSKQKEVNFWEVPLCIEGADDDITFTLKQLGQTISNKVYEIDSLQRKTLHLAAVFACNFPNYLYHIAQQLLADNNIDFNLLRPLIKETADKVQGQLPSAVQTGPAVRKDGQTMQAHLQMLGDNAYLQNVYRLLSEGIMNMAKNGKTA
ncbi:Rossmann-like and DUF2520 domain-containing protein [Mucilaginibacter ginkgonis]|uniref:DUF2520 domain-containing protein n=1 Tax=Mucilaginibacter ginkgonis TaxID=2682091 RepID=A0A6I4I3U3_9SPHI|nr:Rossmann-like and DUF2520 domain-containing protein [Mucilaginibacter ginkgonis]QQL50511.1 DUF2520 domain-containing protein [Mucilaginibacter ginkgonis]